MNYDEVISSVCSKYLIPPDVVISSTRVRWVCAIRHEIMYKLKEADYTVSQIGAILNKDHTSVLYGIKKHLNPKKAVKPMPPQTNKQKKYTQIQYKLRKVGMSKGTMKEMMQDHLSDEVFDYCLLKSLEGRYSNMSEYFADVLTEAYFDEMGNAE